MPGRAVPPSLGDYKAGSLITTRWNDNDPYGHVNNAIYYFWFDTAVNRYLVEQGALDITGGPVIGLVVNTSCDYFAPIAFPDEVNARIRVDRLGNSSVQYGIAIFREGEDVAAAHGHFVHVFVERAENRSVAIPQKLREALERLLV